MGKCKQTERSAFFAVDVRGWGDGGGGMGGGNGAGGGGCLGV